MQSKKSRRAAEGGGSGGLEDVEMQPIFICKNW